MCLKRHLEIRGGRDLFVLQTLSVLHPALRAERSRESMRRLQGIKAITQCFPGVLKPFIGTNLSLLSDPGVCVAILQTHMFLSSYLLLLQYRL